MMRLCFCPKAKTSLKALARIKNVASNPLNSRVSNEDQLDSPSESSLSLNLNGRGGRPYQAPPLAMRTLDWNYQSVGKTPTIRALRVLIREESPDVIFIAESKSKS